jgi:hypothetical protein
MSRSAILTVDDPMVSADRLRPGMPEMGGIDMLEQARTHLAHRYLATI